MLLPSDVARLVLGYLQQEKLASTCRAFIAESPNLKEYADHYTDEGFVPGCVLSLFGKSLTTILNEYVALKAKEPRNEMPLMMASLWKKLDHTVAQIRSMQNSAAFQTHQRARTRSGIEDIRRQRLLTSPVTSSRPGSSVSHHVGQQTSTPIATTQVVLRPLTTQAIANPLFSGPSIIECSSSAVSINNEETLQVVALGPPEKRPPSTSTHSSPMRRKTDSQRRRREPLHTFTAAGGETRQDSDSLQELIDGNFPQMVIENAREKILSNKSLQEKLAENINKFLGRGGVSYLSSDVPREKLESDPEESRIGYFGVGTSRTTKNAPLEPFTPNEGDARSNEPVADNNPGTAGHAFEMDEGHSASQTSIPAGVYSKQKPKERDEHVLLPSQCVTSSATTEKTGDTRTSSPPRRENDQTSTLDNILSCKGDQQSMRSTGTLHVAVTGGNPTIGPNVESQKPLLEPEFSHSQDVEMKDRLPIDEESGAMSSATVFGDRSLLSDARLKEKICEGSTLENPEHPLHEIQQETNESGIATKECLTDSQNVDLLVSADTPVFKDLSPQKERDKQLDATKTPSQTYAQMNVIVDKLQHTANSSTAAAQEPKAQQTILVTAANAEIATLTGLVTGESFVTPILPHCPSVPASGSLPSEFACTTVESAPSSGIAGTAYTSQANADPSNIMSLKILVTEEVTGDAELSIAVSSISGENVPAIISAAKPKDGDGTGVTEVSSAQVADSSMSGDQSHVVPQSKDLSANAGHFQADDSCTVYSVAGTSNLSSDGGFIRLMPATSSSFVPSNSIFIATRMANSSAAKSSNIMMLPSSSTPISSQQQSRTLQTPPRRGNAYTLGQTISPKFSQGSTIILASAVQPMLQGVMGMFPMSVVGQSGKTFTAPSHQVLHVPVSKGGVPKLPLPPISQKPSGSRSLINTGKQSTTPAADSLSRPSSRVQRAENAKKNVGSEMQNKPEEKSLPDTTNLGVKVAETHKRVLCFDGSATFAGTSNSQPLCNSAPPENKDKNEIIYSLGSSAGACSSSKVNLPKDNRKAEKCASSTTGNPSRSDNVASPMPISATSKDAAAEKRPTPAGPSADVLSRAVANKENVLKKETEKQGPPDLNKKEANQESAEGCYERTKQPVQETSKKQLALPNILRKKSKNLPAERTYLTSPLTKQASDILQGMQFHSPTSKQSFGGDLPIPRTPGSGMDESLADDPSDHLRTPTCKRYCDDGGTPKPMLPPPTPELPACSPASETGSENSVSMAAHTLMILSRATIAQTGGSTPLKDNTQQLKASKSTSKKRKLEDAEEYERRSHKKDLHNPTAMLKKKRFKKHRKKILDSFPTGMDVDKFLMSLHYDE
ncbi:hypothetical protein FKM82_009735 [Ascaphus truei]